MADEVWNNLGIDPDLVELLEESGFAKPTPVQAESIPLFLEGRDLIVSAKTGSGKTASFCLPIIEKLMGRRGTYALIMCPTREIALQTEETMKKFGLPMEVKSACLIGGQPFTVDQAALAAGPHVIVGTPGRICDHLDRGNLWFEYIEMVILDEADRMLDMGFSKEINRILTAASLPDRQTLLYSATMPAECARLAEEILKRPKRVSTGEALSVPEKIEHEILWVNEEDKKREALRLINSTEGPIIIFTRTKVGATNLWRGLHAANVYESTFISSSKLQAHREEALEGFRSGKYRVMVATDVAGRGIHVDDVSLVINYDLPPEPEDYIHRIGRTGRKEASGKAVSFVTSSDRGAVRAIEKLIQKEIPQTKTEGFREGGSPSRGRGGPPSRRGPSGGGRSRSDSRGDSRGARSGGGRSGGGRSDGGRPSSGGRSRGPSRPRNPEGRPPRSDNRQDFDRAPRNDRDDAPIRTERAPAPQTGEAPEPGNERFPSRHRSPRDRNDGDRGPRRSSSPRRGPGGSNRGPNDDRGPRRSGPGNRPPGGGNRSRRPAGADSRHAGSDRPRRGPSDGPRDRGFDRDNRPAREPSRPAPNPRPNRDDGSDDEGFGNR